MGHIMRKSALLICQARLETNQAVNSQKGGPRGRVVKVADFSALDHSIISPMWIRASHGE